jgi:hypothetical protein
LSKILKNITVNNISIIDTGIRLAANSSYTIPPQDYLLWVNSLNIIPYIDSGAVVVNDGLRDLTATYGKYFLKYPDEAFNQRFLSDPDRVNGFTSKTTQEAIEESKSSAVSKIRYMASCGFDGNASTGRYLEYNSNVDCKKAGFIIAQPSILRELSLSVESSATVTFTVYKWNGSVETSIATISLSSVRKNVVTGLNVPLISLDEIRIKCTSGSCSRPILFQFYQIV